MLEHEGRDQVGPDELDAPGRRELLRDIPGRRHRAIAWNRPDAEGIGAVPRIVEDHLADRSGRDTRGERLPFVEQDEITHISPPFDLAIHALANAAGARSGHG